MAEPTNTQSSPALPQRPPMTTYRSTSASFRARGAIPDPVQPTGDDWQLVCQCVVPPSGDVDARVIWSWRRDEGGEGG